MSILIKGMEMPKDNTVLLRIYPKDKFNELYVEQLDIDGDTLNEYWAFELPPHGRLIEAEAAKEFLKPIDSLFCYEPEWTWGELYESNCAAIDKLPTIIEAEEGE